MKFCWQLIISGKVMEFIGWYLLIKSIYGFILTLFKSFGYFVSVEFMVSESISVLLSSQQTYDKISLSCFLSFLISYLKLISVFISDPVLSCLILSQIKSLSRTKKVQQYVKYLSHQQLIQTGLLSLVKLNGY